MRCIYCNTPLAAIDYCPGCGADVTLLKRIVRISNLLYNRGLEKATVRDLSGAIACLKQSLKFNKENIDARNLLGLCYYETGEVVLALCEWVVSKNMKPQENLAEEYITRLQNNKNRLDAINQTIRKYNQSIEYCRQGNEDMAIMQLKKVISQNPKLVKAYQLLALLYMKHREYEKARRLLRRAAAVDNTNTTTLRYLTEIEEATGKTSAFGRRRPRITERLVERYEEAEPEQAGAGALRYVSGTETIIQPTTFRDSSTVATLINIALGILLGGAVVWFLVVPASRQAIRDSANQQVTDANTELAAQTARLQDLQEEVDGYVARADSADQERDKALEKAASYEDLLAVASLYVNGEQTSAADALSGLKADQFDGSAKTLYENLLGAVSSSMFSQYYSAGTTAYVAGDYATAAEQLQKAVEADPDNTNSMHYDAMYYLAFAYYNMGNTDMSNDLFSQIITMYPSQASAVQGYIVQNSSGQQPASQGEVSVEGQDTYTQDQSQVQDYEEPAYDPSQVAWTDPTTGLHYDMYGNLLG